MTALAELLVSPPGQQHLIGIEAHDCELGSMNEQVELADPRRSLASMDDDRGFQGRQCADQPLRIARDGPRFWPGGRGHNAGRKPPGIPGSPGSSQLDLRSIYA